MVAVSVERLGRSMKIRGVNDDRILVYRDGCAEFAKLASHCLTAVALLVFQSGRTREYSSVFCRRDRKKDRTEIGAIADMDGRYAVFKH